MAVKRSEISDVRMYNFNSNVSNSSEIFYNRTEYFIFISDSILMCFRHNFDRGATTREVIKCGTARVAGIKVRSD